MKKTLFFPLLAVLLFGCSSDESGKNAEAVTGDPTTIAAPEQAARAQRQCMSGFTVNGVAGVVDDTFTLSWNTCSASYSTTTSSFLEVQPLTTCGATSGTGPLAIQSYPLPNIFSPCTGSFTISVVQVGQKCMNWRFVNAGINNHGEACQTATAWQYFKFVP